MSAPARFQSCPACAAALRWEEVEATRADGDRIPEEDWAYAECSCGYRYELNAPLQDGDAEDAPEPESAPAELDLFALSEGA